MGTATYKQGSPLICEAYPKHYKFVGCGRANGRSLAILSRHRRRHLGGHWILNHQGPRSPYLHAGDLALLRHVALPGLQDISEAQPAELVAFTGNNMPEMWARSNETLASGSDWPVLTLRVAGSGQCRDVVLAPFDHSGIELALLNLRVVPFEIRYLTK
jgi:hypothetical protein